MGQGSVRKAVHLFRLLSRYVIQDCMTVRRLTAHLIMSFCLSVYMTLQANMAQGPACSRFLNAFVNTDVRNLPSAPTRPPCTVHRTKHTHTE